MQATATDLVSTVVAAENLHAAVTDLGALLLQQGAIAGIEWWTPEDGGSTFRREVAAGTMDGARATIELGPAGRLVVIGDSEGEPPAVLDALGAVLRRRWSEELLADQASRLARRAEALADFAGLVAHDVKSSLVMALREDDPRAGVARALELVDSILEAVRVEHGATGTSRLQEVVERAIDDVGRSRPEIVANAAGEFPMPPDALRLVLRNLLANAIAAGANRIHVSALAEGDQRLLVVDDDGVGIASSEQYVTGSQLGLSMCRRLVERCGARLELRPRAAGGTRAVIAGAGTGR